ncbi:MAG: hypothetical protein HOP28_08985 [Gemmatimonadales bacterium]|nr:hypothetical protein [Gemmatimonadales bacterium]
MSTVYVAIGCDTDPDRREVLDGTPSERLAWRGMLEGIPLLKGSLGTIRDSRGREPVFTWLLRVDEQIRRMEGTYAWVLEAHRPFLRGLEAAGDELGWHPHFWRFDLERRRWYQEVRDADWQVEMLRAAHAAYVAHLGGGPKSVRMGWGYHNNRTFATLEELGLLVDFSAIPGLATLREGAPPHEGNLFDWSPTPRHPYRPARADCRRPALGTEPAHRLLEAPNFVSTSRLWGLVSGLQMARKTGSPAQLSRALRRPTYWVNLTGRPALFAPLVRALGRAVCARNEASTLFATYFHPDELLPNRSGLYSLESVRANLASILETCARAGAAVEFIPASRIAGLSLT